MAKTKKKNKGGGGAKRKVKTHGSKKKSFRSPGEVNSEASTKVKVDNRFEIRMNRNKHDNLGRRGRHEKGIPGISRSKAIEKRRETLLKEYKVRNKSSVFTDKRIGEKIKNMSEEEKIVRRSVMEKKRQYKQKSIFNLPSTDDILTHKGKVLTDIDRYEDPRDETDSEDERLNEEFVSDAHFSGDFLKVKAKSDDHETEEADDQKSRKDIIAELILSSKMRKMEKAKEADETYELVSKLDEEFKTPDFRNLLTFVGKDRGEAKEPGPVKKEDYDKIVRELHFETKTGLASNRLKTEGEIQEEELNKLQKLERDRIRRMQARDPNVPTHKSADELTDGFEAYEDIPVLSYENDGQLRLQTPVDESSAEEEEEDDNESDEESESDAFSDLLTDDEEAGTPHTKSKKKSTTQAAGVEVTDTTSGKDDDIPFIITIPKTYEDFKKLMTRYKAQIKDDEHHIARFKTVTDRLVKYSLLADKNRLPELFLYLLRFVVEVTCQSYNENVQRIKDVATAHLHTLLLSNPVKCVELMEGDINLQSLISKKSKDLTIGKIIFYEMFSRIFCVTDFCHRVLSPMKVDMLDIITSYNISSYMGLLKVLAVVDVLYELCKDSKRYCPEVLKLLIDVLEGVSLPPEKLRFKRRRFDFLRVSPADSEQFNWKDVRSHTVSKNEEGVPSGSQVLSLLLRIFDITNAFVEIQHRTRPMNNLIFKAMKVEMLLLKMPWTNESFHEELFSRKLNSSIVLPQGGPVDDDLPAIAVDKPKMLKLYEPLIEDNFDGNRRKKLKRKGLTQEESRLSHKVKKEMKSAVREIIKDNAFLAKQQLKEQAIRDAERSRKVKELLGSLSNQEGDYRRLKRQK